MAGRLIEVFAAGCPFCEATVKLLQELACENCEIQVYDLRDGSPTNREGLQKTAQYGIHRLPTVVVDGKLAECCKNQQPISRKALIAVGIGQG